MASTPAEPARPPEAPPEEKFPFEVRTVLQALWGRRRFLAGALVLSLVVGVLTGAAFGTKVYEAETVLLYKPETSDTSKILTLLNIVEIQANLEGARKRLDLPVSVQTLGSACRASVERNTKLLTIRAKWDDPKVAADLANTLRDVFLENQRDRRREELSGQINDLDRRLGEVSKALDRSEGELQDFVTRNRVVDLDKQAQWYLEEQTQVEVLYEQARADQKTIDLQAANLDRIIGNLRQKIAQEEAQSTGSGMDSLGDINIRVQRLRDSIHDDRTYRAGQAQLAQKELEFRRAERLRAKGLVSQSELDQARAAYEAQLALSEDTGQIQEWKEQIDDLNAKAIPKKGASSQSAPILQDMMLKGFEIELQQVAAREKVIHLSRVRDSVRKKIDGLTSLQRRFQVLKRDVESKEAEKKELEGLLASARRDLESGAADFAVISQAEVPQFAVSSNRKMLAVAGAGATFMVLLGTALAGCLLDPRVRSAPELGLKLDLRVLGAVPDLPSPPLVLPEGDEVSSRLAFLAHRVRQALPEAGGAVLVASASPGEGRSTVAASVGAALGRQDERVLLVDAQFRPSPGEKGRSLSTLGGERGKGPGLADLLRGEAASEDVLVRSVARGVDLLAAGRRPDPDLLGSHRWAPLLAELRQAYSVVLVESAAAGPAVDADLLAPACDALLLVVQAEREDGPTLRRIKDRLQETAPLPTGAVLNRVRKNYASLE